MNACYAQSKYRLNDYFRLRFQGRLTEYRSQHGSAAKGFGLVWEKTLEEVPVDDVAQGQLYRGLIKWAKRQELYAILNERSKSASTRKGKSGLEVADSGVFELKDYEEISRRLSNEARAEV